MGISTETYEQNDQCDEYAQKNGQGEVIEVVTFNPRSEITILGETYGALGGPMVGQKFTFLNFVLTFYPVQPIPPAGIAIIKSIQTSKGRAKNAQVRMSATFYPLVSP